MKFVDGAIVRDAGVSSAMLARGAARGERLDRRRARQHPRGRRRRSRARRPRPPRGLHRAPAQALVRPVGEVEDPRARRRRGRVPRAASSRARAGPAAIVHGDYRLDNCMLGDDGRIVAVLDWELCTLGDPLADVGLLMVYWNDPGEEGAIGAAPTAVSGLPIAARSCSTATPRRRAATCRTSTSTSRSATGSSRASSRASTRATSAARWAPAIRARSRRSPFRSSAALPTPPRPWRGWASSSDPLRAARRARARRARRSSSRSRAGSTPGSARRPRWGCCSSRSRPRRSLASMPTRCSTSVRADRRCTSSKGVYRGLTWPSTELRADEGSRRPRPAAARRRGARPSLVPVHERGRRPRGALRHIARHRHRRVPRAGPAHAGPPLLACSAATPELAEGSTFLRATIDVPAGVQAAIERACADRGLPAIGVWAQVPHYAAAMPYPAASAALLEGVSRIAGRSLPFGELRARGRCHPRPTR